MIDELASSVGVIIAELKINAPYLLWIFIVIWGVYVLTLITHKKLLYLGIVPRHLYGLPGILFAPLLHANFNHVFFNTIPLLVLSNFILIGGLHYYLYVTLIIALFSGFLIWCFAKPGIHLGASSVITGYWAFLVSNIYEQGTLIAIILGVICLYYFIGILYSIFPSEKGISWEGHLFGCIAGGLVSYLGLGQSLMGVTLI